MLNSTRKPLIAVVVAAVGLAIVRCSLSVREQVRDEARASYCRTQIKNLFYAVEGYKNSKGVYPPASGSDAYVPPDRGLSWITLVTPWLDDFSGTLRCNFDRMSAWDSEKNRIPTVHSRTSDNSAPEVDLVFSNLLAYPSLFCPSSFQGRSVGVTHFVGITGLGPDSADLPKGHPRAGIFGYSRQTTSADIQDGLAQTMMLAETSIDLGPWIAGGTPTIRAVDPARRPYIGPGRPFGGNHRAGVNVAFADGSVRLVRETVNPKVFEALSTISGGEPLPEIWDRN